MVALSDFMRDNANYFAPSLKTNGKIHATCSINPSKCLPALAPYCNAKVPERLQKFISSTYGTFFGTISWNSFAITYI